MPISLGDVVLDGFEVNARIAFGGRQALAVHKLPGGVRVVDAMGPDDAPIGWHGILTGSSASARARAIDSLRLSGTPISLRWDVFTATVIVSELQLEFCNSWWIPYNIRCTVIVGTDAVSVTDAGGSALGDVLADLGQIRRAPGIATAIALASAQDATVAGSQANAAAMIALNDASTSILASIALADAAMSGDDILQLTRAASTLAFLTTAAGYTGRAQLNFEDIQV